MAPRPRPSAESESASGGALRPWPRRPPRPSRGRQERESHPGRGPCGRLQARTDSGRRRSVAKRHQPLNYPRLTPEASDSGSLCSIQRRGHCADVQELSRTGSREDAASSLTGRQERVETVPRAQETRAAPLPSSCPECLTGAETSVRHGGSSHGDQRSKATEREQGTGSFAHEAGRGGGTDGGGAGEGAGGLHARPADGDLGDAARQGRADPAELRGAAPGRIDRPSLRSQRARRQRLGSCTRPDHARAARDRDAQHRDADVHCGSRSGGRPARRGAPGPRRALLPHEPLGAERRHAHHQPEAGRRAPGAVRAAARRLERDGARRP